LPVELDYSNHVYHQYTIRISGGRRDDVSNRLAKAGIQSMIYYPVPLHKLPVYAHMTDVFPRCEEAAAEVLSLPIWPTLQEDAQDRIIEEVRTALS
jgi:dTDP-4-amino-4,6-dideoxygalactose transaminase